MYQECEASLAAQHAARQIDLVIRPHTAPMRRVKAATPSPAMGEHKESADDDDTPRSSSDTPFAICEPYLSLREVRRTADARSGGDRPASAQGTGGGGGSGVRRFVSRTSFESAPTAWHVGPGSYGLPERSSKHSPTFSYTSDNGADAGTGTGTDKQIQQAIESIRRGGGSAAAQLAQAELAVEPRASRSGSGSGSRGPLLSPQFASSHAAHSREEVLRSMLAQANAIPTVARVHIRPLASDFAASNAGRGANISGGSDVGYRSRPAPPSGPTRAASLRPDWSQLQVYVPPAVTGPRVAFGEGGTAFTPQLDPATGLALHSQARLKILRAKARESGHDLEGHGHLRNFLAENHRSQATPARPLSAQQIAARNDELALRALRAARSEQDRARSVRARWEEAVIEKDAQVRLERRAQAVLDAEAPLRAWLAHIVLARTAAELHARLKVLQWARAKEAAARRIWRVYTKWKIARKDKIAKMKQRKQKIAQHVNWPGASMQPQLMKQVTLAAAAAAAILPARDNAIMSRRASAAASRLTSPAASKRSSLVLSSGNSSGSANGGDTNSGSNGNGDGGDGGALPSSSPKLHLGLSLAVQHLRTGVVPADQFSERTALAIREKGLGVLMAQAAAEEAAGIIVDFLRWAIHDRFKNIKEAMLTFRRKARLIQKWWRNHLLAQQWRLWIQAVQFLGFRERTTTTARDQQPQPPQQPTARPQSATAQARMLASPNKGTAKTSKSRAGASSSRTDEEAKQQQQQQQQQQRPPSQQSRRSRPSSPDPRGDRQPSSAAAYYSTVAVFRPGGWDSHMPSDDYDDPSLASSADSAAAAAAAATSMGASGSSRVKFAAGAGAAGASGVRSSSPVLAFGGRRPRAPFRDPGGLFVGEGLPLERSSSSKMAQRLFAQLVFEEDILAAPSSTTSSASASAAAAAAAAPSGSAAILAKKLALKKFNVPNRLPSAPGQVVQLMDKHSSLVQWNVLMWFLKDVFAERLRMARARFRSWMRAMRIQGMREELLQLSNTVKPLTKQQKADIATTAALANAAATPTKPKRTRGGGDSSDSSDNEEPTPRPSARPSSSGKSRSGGSSFSSFFSRVRSPAFFKLLLSDTEMAAMHRAMNMLLAHPDPRWLRDGSVHSVHFILLRPGAGAGGRGGYNYSASTSSANNSSTNGTSFAPPTDLSSFVPLVVGNVAAGRRLAMERAFGARAREAHVEAAAALALERARLAEQEARQREQDEALVATLRRAHLTSTSAVHKRNASFTRMAALAKVAAASTSSHHRRTPSAGAAAAAADNAHATASGQGPTAASSKGFVVHGPAHGQSSSHGRSPSLHMSALENVGE